MPLFSFFFFFVLVFILYSSVFNVALCWLSIFIGCDIPFLEGCFIIIIVLKNKTKEKTVG